MAKTVKDYMSPAIEKTLGTPVRDAIASMVTEKCRVIVVTNPNHHVRGIITGTDIIREIERDVNSSRLTQGRVENIMSSVEQSIIYVTEDSIMLDAVEKMHRHHLQAPIVLRGLEPVGVLYQLDVIRWWHDEFAAEAGPH